MEEKLKLAAKCVLDDCVPNAHRRKRKIVKSRKKDNMSLQI